MLIPFLSASNVLYVDAATYAVSFLLLAGFVPKTKKLAGAVASGGVLAGIKFFLRDRLLAPARRDGDRAQLRRLGARRPRSPSTRSTRSGARGIAGLFYTAGGAGALVGSIAAMFAREAGRAAAAGGSRDRGMTLPLWLLPLGLPAWGVMAALFAMMLFVPFVNGPVIGVITARTPAELRPKVMTALISVSTLAPARLPRRRAAARAPGSRRRCSRPLRSG